jgi:endonuclease G
MMLLFNIKNLYEKLVWIWLWMAPAADMSTDESMAQSFSLANMVPQAPINNRNAWAKLEKDTRKYIKRASGDVYVITGPVFEPKSKTIGANHVWVPKYLYKLVYDPTANKVWAHWIENTDDAQIAEPISYQEVVKRTGIIFLPDQPL